MDLQVRLAMYQTRLAEKRTAISELQLGVVLVTLPLTLHTALMLLMERHAMGERLDLVVPLSAFLGGMVVCGVVLAFRGGRALRCASRDAEVLRRGIEQP